MNEPMLLQEHWGQPSKVTDSTLTEAKGSTTTPGLYIEGIFMQADVVNRNKRLYKKSVLEKAVSKYIKEQVNTKQALGELNHPARAMVDPNEAAIIIEELWWEGSNVLGRAKVIEGDNGPGDKLAANIRAGWIPGVSSRGLGTVTENSNGYSEVNPGFVITVGVDVVWGPSAPDAYVKPIQVEQANTQKPVVEQKNTNEDFKKLTEVLSSL